VPRRHHGEREAVDVRLRAAVVEAAAYEPLAVVHSVGRIQVSLLPRRLTGQQGICGEGDVGGQSAMPLFR
jgi:hypothetical protein